jgi:hypothetical protein
VFLLAMGSKSYPETAQGNTVFVSMISGGFVFDGEMEMLTMWKSRIITRRQKQW